MSILEGNFDALSPEEKSDFTSKEETEYRQVGECECECELRLGAALDWGGTWTDTPQRGIYSSTEAILALEHLTISEVLMVYSKRMDEQGKYTKRQNRLVEVGEE